MFTTILIIVIIWTIVSVIYTIENMGRKYRKDKWYDYPLSVPIFSIAVIAELYFIIKDKFQKENK